MSGAQSISTRRAYGRAAGLPRVAPRPLQCVCAAAGDTVSCTVSSPRADRRCPGRRPGGPHSPGARSLAVSWRGLPKSLGEAAGRGMRTSKERVRRLMREHDLQTPPRAGHAHGPKAHDGTITTEAPDVMWGTDMTATVTVAEGAAFVFVAVDHCATACIGLHAAKRGTRFEALEPIRQGIRERFGGIGDGVARGLRLRHDHGSNYLADDFHRRSRSSASKAPRASCGSPKATASRSASSAR